MAEGHTEGSWKCEDERFHLDHSDGEEEASDEELEPGRKVQRHPLNNTELSTGPTTKTYDNIIREKQAAVASVKKSRNHGVWKGSRMG